MTLELEEFAKVLVEHVRDEAIRSCDRRLQADTGTAKVKRWKAARAEQPEEFAKTLIADVVDQTIGYLLNAIDEELLLLSFKASNGKNIDLTRVASDFGELSGSYGGEWCQKYTKERFVDDFADLRVLIKKRYEDDQNGPAGV